MSRAQSAVKHLDSLRSQREELSKEIHHLFQQPATSDLELGQLKRKRLMLKDRMAAIHQTTG